MSFDDGPSDFTNELIDNLNSAGVKATFFLIGSKIDNNASYAAIVKKAYNSGHMIGSHTYTHPYLTHLTDDDIRTEMIKTDKAIFNAIGVYPRYMRCPYSDIDQRVYAVIQSMGFLNIFTSLDPDDSDLATNNPSQIANNYVSTVKANAPASTNFISTQHDTLEPSVNQVPQIVAYVKGNSTFSIVPMPSCVTAGSTGSHNTNSGYRALTCGDGFCDGYIEDCATCPKDCGTCPSGTAYTYASTTATPTATAGTTQPTTKGSRRRRRSGIVDGHVFLYEHM